jgi:hypothetical protein
MVFARIIVVSWLWGQSLYVCFLFGTGAYAKELYLWDALRIVLNRCFRSAFAGRDYTLEATLVLP